MFILTTIYVIYTGKMMKTSNEALKQNETIFKESRKPEVIAYFDVERTNILNFFVKNIGESLAINTIIYVELIKGNLKRERFWEANILGNNIATLAPKQQLKNFVDMFFDLKDENGDFPIVKIKVEYEDEKGEIYNSSYVYDLNMYKGNSEVVNKDIHDLVKQVEKLNKSVEKLSK